MLLLDLGNTRLKWARWREGGIAGVRAIAHAGFDAERFARALAPAARGALRASLVSVAPDSLRRQLEIALRDRLGLELHVATSTRRAAGVVNGYREPWRLGADRWLAVIGAVHLPGRRRHRCVVDVGTAMTIDVVSAGGRHIGGAIVPGADLMVRTLLADTGGIAARATRRKQRSRRGRSPLLARDTRAALESGARHALAALTERAVEQARATLRARGVEVVLTGGGAREIAPLLRTPHRIVDDLVLRGLAVLECA